jgi:hypothetical protein
MQYLQEIFAAVARQLGTLAVGTWAGLVGTYYAWNWLGWSWLATLNGYLALIMVPMLHVAAVTLMISAIIKVGLWIKSLFGSEE